MRRLRLFIVKGGWDKTCRLYAAASARPSGRPVRDRSPVLHAYTGPHPPLVGQLMKFQGSSGYVATADLMLAVNAAITLKRPLLVKGEPGTGKTMLAEEVASALNMPLLQWHIKSTTKAQQGLYEYDAVSRLRDSQLADPESSEKVRDIHNYIVKGTLWQAFTA